MPCVLNVNVYGPTDTVALSPKMASVHANAKQKQKNHVINNYMDNKFHLTNEKT